MRKPVLIGFLLLLPVMALILWVTGKGGGGRDREMKRLNLQDAARVESICIVDAGDSLFMERSGNRWIMEGDTLYSRSVENLLYAASNLQVVSVLSPQQAGELRETRKVVFCRKDRVIRSYVVAISGQQFVISPDGSDNLYAVTLPGHSELDPGQVFSASPNHYLEHVLIRLKPTEISYIEVERRGGRAFRLSMDEKGNFSASLLDPEEDLPPDRLDDLSLRLLFSYFTVIRFEERLIPAPGSGPWSRENENWLGRLKVRSVTGEEHNLQLFSMPGEEEGEAHMFRALVRYNDEPEILVVNYIYLDVLMRGINHYFASGA